MTVAILRCILLCLLVVSVIQAEPPVTTPPCAPLMKTWAITH